MTTSQLNKERKKDQESVQQLSELVRANFTRQWNYELQKDQLECPTVFYLTAPNNRLFDPRDWVSTEYRLHLVCQYVQQPHSVDMMGYSVRQSEKWWSAVSPWLNTLIGFLKVCVPLAGAATNAYDQTNLGQMKADIDLVKEIVSQIPENIDSETLKTAPIGENLGSDTKAVGAALRVLSQFLQQADPTKHWHGLAPVTTYDGNILWLCPEHQAQYKNKA